MQTWIKYRIPKKLSDSKNKNIKIEEFNEFEHKDIIPQIYADAFCDKAWESDWYKIDLFNPASCFIAKYHEEHAGFIISFIKENSAYISVIAVLKKYQKCGIGISLINRVINYFKNQDFEIYLDVESKNKTAINWYNKRGFIQIIESTTLCTNKKHGVQMKTKDIETERLILRSMTLDDADFAAKLWGDPENGKYLADQPYKNGDELRKVIYDIDEWEDEYPFIAVCKNTGEPVATCCLGTEGPKDHWGFGYTVKKDLWGQGLATEMVKALINFAYSLGVRNFYCTVAKENKASCRVMEKCGLKIQETKAFKKRNTDMEFESNIYTMTME